MQPWIDRHPFTYVLVVFPTLWIGVSFVISFIGGWFFLARRFPFRGTFDGAKWRGQSGYMRALAHYGNCLTLGASPEGLFLAVLFLFRAAHPPLFIPWNQITVTRTRILFFNRVRFQLGRERPIPLSIHALLAARLKVAAGNGWPVESLE